MKYPYDAEHIERIYDEGYRQGYKDGYEDARRQFAEEDDDEE